MRILIYLILLLYPFNLISGQKKQKRLSDDELMTLVQKQTFRYFWDFAHPESGLAHERSNGGAETATIGGSGFGVMAIIVGIERGFITREQGATYTEDCSFLERQEYRQLSRHVGTLDER